MVARGASADGLGRAKRGAYRKAGEADRSDRGAYLKLSKPGFSQMEAERKQFCADLKSSEADPTQSRDDLKLARADLKQVPVGLKQSRSDLNRSCPDRKATEANHNVSDSVLVVFRHEDACLVDKLSPRVRRVCALSRFRPIGGHQYRAQSSRRSPTLL